MNRVHFRTVTGSSPVGGARNNPLPAQIGGGFFRFSTRPRFYPRFSEDVSPRVYSAGVKVVEVPPERCPAGHRFADVGCLVGWDNTHAPPCRVYVCRRCDARVWVERIRYRTV